MSGHNLVDITADGTSISTLLFSNSIVNIRSLNNDVYTNNTYNTFDRSSEKLIGARFLEIVAAKVFGHAKASTAIGNYTSYYNSDYSPNNSQSMTLIGQITRGISNGIYNKRGDIFNEYVLTDKFTDSVSTTPTNINGILYWDFNFDNTIWEFPIIFNTDISTTGNINTSELNNGPNVGGTQLQFGTISIPREAESQLAIGQPRPQALDLDLDNLP